MIIFDENYKEIGQAEIDVDVEVGTTKDSSNDFELNSTIPFYGWYIPNTEMGGVVEYSWDSTENGYITYRGYTWRGLISISKIICPPQGQDYYIADGEANSIIEDILGDVLGGFFEISSENSYCYIENYQMPLYVNALDGIETMLESYGFRLQIKAERQNDGLPVKVILEAVQATTLDGIYNRDNRFPMAFEVNEMGINHLICGGSGQLQERMRVNLYIDQNGNVSENQSYFGFDERVAFFDFGNAESRDDLVDKGKERLLELASSKSMEIKPPDDADLEVGDKLHGVFPDGTELVKPIVAKIYKITKGLIQTEYKIKGEN